MNEWMNEWDNKVEVCRRVVEPALMFGDSDGIKGKHLLLVLYQTYLQLSMNYACALWLLNTKGYLYIILPDSQCMIYSLPPWPELYWLTVVWTPPTR